ncbi:HIT family protein [Pseudonocardia sulfidoxydans NBRC 16205]|uniref:HIT family protein n=1 Tax=Pseudonocardia sulfidoxydans NBRC 16205 TaxID=1223511 RepID=A0A511DA69_9PSEU|nr:HIT family protein [Pseudonocardia sulfidoxydans NBRC 16205]
MSDSQLYVPDAGDCAFCAYLDGDRPYTILRRTGLAAVLVTREQRGLGHVLVIPIAHRPTLIDLGAAESNDVMRLLISSAKAIDRAMQPGGISVWQNNGVPSDQTIPHTHFHVAGTYPDRGTDRGPVPELSLAETEAIADRLDPWF